MQTEIAANIRVLTTTQKYEDEETLPQMLDQLGLSAAARRKLVDDDIVCM